MIPVGGSLRSGRVNSLQVSSSAYGRCIPVIAGRTRIVPLNIWAYGFHIQYLGKKGKASKGGKVTTSAKKAGLIGAVPDYTTGADFITGEYLVLDYLAAWRNSDRYGVYIGSQDVVIQHTLTDDYNYSEITNYPAGAIPVAITGIFLPNQPYSFTVSDFGAAGPVTLAGNSSQWLYEEATLQLPVYFWSPSAPSLRTGYPYPFVYVGEYNAGQLSSLGTWKLVFHPGHTPPFGTDGFSTQLIGSTVTVYYAYALPLKWAADPTPLGILFLQPEANLGSGTEYSDNDIASQQIIYPDVSGVGSSTFDLGASGYFPNWSLEATGIYPLTFNGDAHPGDLIQAIVNSGPVSYWGANVGVQYNVAAGTPNGTIIGSFGYTNQFLEPNSLANFYNFCYAYQIYISAYMDSQRKAAEWIQDILDITNTAPVWSGMQLKLIPRCEVSAVGDNAALYQAPSGVGPVYSITENVIVPDAPGMSPITVDRKRQSDAFNVQRVEHLERANDYNTNITTAVDQGSIQNYGSRPAPVATLHMIQDAVTAMKTATMMVQRSTTFRNTYKFNLPLFYSLLEPMDILTIPNPTNPANTLNVRIRKVSETKDHLLRFECEDYVYGANAPTPLVTAATNPNPRYNNQPPGSVNTPVIFEAVPGLVPNSTTTQIGIAASGSSPDWGGCDVWASVASGPYVFLGRIVGRAIQGYTTADFPSHADPDMADTLYADFTESMGAVSSVPTALRDAFATATLIGSASGNPPYELISWSGVTLLSTYHYSFNPTLRRGVFGSPIADHASGSPIVVLGAGVLYVPMPQAWAGQVVTFKLTSFNTLFESEELLANVTAYTFTPTGTVGGYQFQNYTLIASSVLTQGTAPSHDDEIYVAPFTAQFSTGPISLLGHNFVSLSDSATYWVTVADPALVSEISGINAPFAYYADTDATRSNTPGYVYCGKIVMSPSGSAVGTAGGSAGPR